MSIKNLTQPYVTFGIHKVLLVNIKYSQVIRFVKESIKIVEDNTVKGLFIELFLLMWGLLYKVLGTE